MNETRRTLWTAVALLAFACVFAQDEPKQEAEADSKPVVVRPKAVFDLGWINWQLGGNERRFKQYARPANGWSLGEASYLWGNDARTAHFFGAFRGSPEEDYWTGASLALFGGGTVLDGSLRKNGFFDPVPLLVDESAREVGEATLQQAIGPARLSLRYQMDKQDEYFLAPREPLRQRTRFLDALLGAEVGSGRFQLGATERTYWDRTNVLPDTDVVRYDAILSQQLGPALHLEGGYLQHKIRVGGGDENEVETWLVRADWDLGERTLLGLGFRHDDIDLPTVRGASVQKRIETTARLNHRFGEGWSASFGYRHLETERIRTDRSAVEVPIRDAWSARVWGRVAPNLKLSLRGVYDHLRGWPTVVSDDTRPLWWDDRAALDAQLDWFVGTGSVYAAFGHSVFVNDGRDATLRSTSFVLGGSFEVTDRLSVFAEHQRENHRARAAGEPEFDAFFPGG
ncbi:MAG: hypothetical protein N2109_11775, partial [Fimbriimonadales bacterium]|nr:hypothetical protein [Fimbriimonadales bacterium]